VIYPGTFPVSDVAVLVTCAAIYGVAAIFSGLSGFGFSAIGALTLCFLPPSLAVSMLMLLSLITQAMSFSNLWREMRDQGGAWHRRDGVIPYCAGGALGMPIGLKILVAADANLLMGAFGALLVLYSLYSLFKPTQLKLRGAGMGWRSSVLVGAVGGIVGGFTAFPGSAVVVWAGLKGATKEQCRALTQPFVFFMQLLGLGSLLFARPEIFNAAFWAMLAAMLPLAIGGSFLGVAIYRKTSQINYRKITFVALGLSGAGLLIKLAAA
jgi:uncharacterized protein